MPTKPTFAQDFKEMMDKWDEVMAWVKKNNAGISDADAYEVTKRIFDKNLKLTPSNARLSAICDRELARVGLAEDIWFDDLSIKRIKAAIDRGDFAAAKSMMENAGMENIPDSPSAIKGRFTQMLREYEKE
jgi:hypothetical protein